MMLSKSPTDMSLDELRKAQATLARWISVEADDGKRRTLRVEIEAVEMALKRRKRR
jgi:hypothetical protein